MAVKAFEILKDWLQSLEPGTKLSRRAWLEIKYTAPDEKEAKDISEDISKYFLSLDYSDNLSGSVDDIDLVLEDRAQLWAEEWFPKTESMLEISLHCYNWTNVNEGEKVFQMGSFEIDEIELQGFPTTVHLKAVSVVGNSTLRGVQRNQTWENISIWKCADDICQRNNLKLYWDCADNPNLDHIEQADESDLHFMMRICQDNGRSLKVTPDQVIIFDDDRMEQQEPILEIVKPGLNDHNPKYALVHMLSNYSLKIKTRDIYWKCVVRYQKGKKKEVIQGEFVNPDMEKGNVLHAGDQVENQAEAERLAKKKLRDANKEQFTGTFSSLGDFRISAGLTAILTGFGVCDGKYIITKAAHRIGSTYTTEFDVRKCLNGY